MPRYSRSTELSLLNGEMDSISTTSALPVYMACINKLAIHISDHCRKAVEPLW